MLNGCNFSQTQLNDAADDLDTINSTSYQAVNSAQVFLMQYFVTFDMGIFVASILGEGTSIFADCEIKMSTPLYKNRP